VLNVDRSDSVKGVDELDLVPGAIEATEALHRAGYVLLVITNQSVVGRGLLDIDTMHAVNRELDRRLGHTLHGFYVCPHTPGAGCACRKPETLLIEQARVAWPFDPAATWFVVDADRDIEAAHRAGVRPALVRTGKGADTERRHADVPAFDDLRAFSTWLLAQE
jgi:D-glycero-D-manno-heptose 1,7-bisphosphate phosphatase